jgi:hypothetical protein
VELVLHRRNHCSCLQRINALLIEWLTPVQGFQVIQLELVQNKQHASDNFRFVQEAGAMLWVFLSQEIVVRVRLIQDTLTFVPNRKNQ